MVCTFDPASPRLTAYDIHEWPHAELRIQESQVCMIQIDGIKRQVFIKIVDKDSMHAVLRDTCGRAKYRFPTGEMFMVNIGMAVMGTKGIRIANLPPEVHNETIHEALTPFGKVLNIHEEKWARTYQYPVPNGERQVSLHLTRHLPSHIIIAGNRVLISYEGQSATCYGCRAIGHLHQVCPMRRVKERETQGPAKSIYASVVTNTVITHSGEMEDKNTTTCTEESQNTPATLTKTPQTAHPLLIGTTKILPEIDTEPNKTRQMDTTPVPADEAEDERPCCSHMDGGKMTGNEDGRNAPQKQPVATTDRQRGTRDGRRDL